MSKNSIDCTFVQPELLLSVNPSCQSTRIYTGQMATSDLTIPKLLNQWASNSSNLYMGRFRLADAKSLKEKDRSGRTSLTSLSRSRSSHTGIILVKVERLAHRQSTLHQDSHLMPVIMQNNEIIHDHLTDLMHVRNNNKCANGSIWCDVSNLR